MLVSVIIPTFNRRELFRETLASLTRQSLPMDRFEVLVIDDGSTDDTEKVVAAQYPYKTRYVRQPKAGATAARNRGAVLSKADVLIFLDDDVMPYSSALSALSRFCAENGGIVAMGKLVPSNEAGRGTLLAKSIQKSSLQPGRMDFEQAHFVECKTGLLAIRRSDFLELGMLRDVTGGWPNWDDVEFGYRAHLRGFRFLQSNQPLGKHRDYALADISIASDRSYKAAYAAAKLFVVHPGLFSHLEMFHDKSSVNVATDPLPLLIRKLARRLSASPPVTWAFYRCLAALEAHYPHPLLLQPLYRWIIGAALYHGYLDGVRANSGMSAPVGLSA